MRFLIIKGFLGLLFVAGFSLGTISVGMWLIGKLVLSSSFFLHKREGNMQPVALSLLLIFLLAACQNMTTAGSKRDIEAAAESWIAALNACAVDRMVALYDREAVLWPTTSREIANSPDKIRQYFERVCSSPIRPQGGLNEQHVRMYGDMALNSGTYTFTVMRDGKPVAIPARFSFTYRRTGGQWLIVDHHSSGMPATPR